MAWLVGDGFDFYATGVAGSSADIYTGPSPLWTLGAGVGTILGSASTRFGVGGAINPSNGGNMLSHATGSNDPEVIVNFAWFYGAALSGTNIMAGVTLGDGATAQCSIAMRSDGAMLLTSGALAGSTLATFAGAFIASTWAHFQIRIVINNSTGAIHVRKDGATSDTFSSTGLNTRGGTSNNYTNQVSVAGGASPNNNTRFDDFYVFSTTGSIPNDWQGDVRALQLMAASDPGSPLFSKSPNTGTSFSKINEANEDGDTTYIFDSNVGDEDDFGIATLASTPTAIVAVQAKMFCKKSDAGARSGDLFLKSGASSVNFGSTALSSTYGYLNLPQTTDPNTAAAWTQSGVNALTVGPKVTA